MEMEAAKEMPYRPVSCCTDERYSNFSCEDMFSYKSSIKYQKSSRALALSYVCPLLITLIRQQGLLHSLGRLIADSTSLRPIIWSHYPNGAALG
jgi:hypothetical protein